MSYLKINAFVYNCSAFIVMNKRNAVVVINTVIRNSRKNIPQKCDLYKKVILKISIYKKKLKVNKKTNLKKVKIIEIIKITIWPF